MNKKILLIVNGSAGKKRARGVLFDIVDIFSSNNYDATVVTTQYQNHATEIAQKYSASFDVIVCCGGDGTLSETISGVMKSGVNTNIGYIPTGSTNDMAYTLKLPVNDIAKCCNIITNSTSKNHDIGLFNSERYFSYVASFGTLSDISHNTSQSMKNVFGHLAYVLNGIKSITKLKSYNVTAKYDDKVITGNFILGAISNSTSMGGILKMNNPEINLNDGLFEVILVNKPKNMMVIPDILSRVLKQDFDNDYFIRFTTGKVTFETQEPIDWSLDGEYCIGKSVDTIENIKSGIKLIY